MFAFVVVQSPVSANRIIVCDRGKPCQTYNNSHIEAEILDEIEHRKMTWPQFMSHYAQTHPHSPMWDKARAWKRSQLFTAWVTILIDDDTEHFRMTKLESLHHYITAACVASPILRHTIGKFLQPTTFDQQDYPICWVVSVIWLLALLPRLTGARDGDLSKLVERVMNARTMDRWVDEIHHSTPTRHSHMTWRMPRSIVNDYTTEAGPHAFDLRQDSEGGFPFLLLNAALRSVGISLKSR